MDDFSLAFDDNRQSLSVATAATTLAQLTSQFDDLHLGNGDATAASLLNGLVGVGGLGSIGGLHNHHHHHHHTLASLAAGPDSAGLLDRHHHHHHLVGGIGNGCNGVNDGHQTPNSTNVLDTFVAMVSGLTAAGVCTNGGGVGNGLTQQQPCSNSGNGSSSNNNSTGSNNSSSSVTAVINSSITTSMSGSSNPNGKLEERPVKYKSHTECVPVPSSEHVAEIVGRQGCKIKALRAKTNTFIKTPIRGEEPIFVITGTKEDVTRAKQEILSAADHFSTLRSSKKQAIALLAESRNMLGYSMPDEITIQIRVPQKVVGLVVGPKGATIKNIQLKTNTYIITPKRNQESVFEITGLPTNVHTARQLIEEHIATRAGTTSATSAGNGGGGGGGGGSSGGSGSSSSSSSSSTTSSSGSSSSSSGHHHHGLGSGVGLSRSGSSNGNGPHLGCLSGSAGSLIGGFLGNGTGGGGLLTNGNQYHHHLHHLQEQPQHDGSNHHPHHHLHQHHHHHPHQGTLLNSGLSVSALNDGGGNNGNGLLGATEQDFEGNQFIIDNLLEYFNNMSGNGTNPNSAYLSPTSLGGGVGGTGSGGEHIPDFRSIWENLSESQTSGTTTDTDNSSLVWTLPSSPRNSVSYSPDDFIFQR
uniref:K Homology domain-containing protein n=1 Tax=Anopheles epiroticus TaxID=199890 RepID=A0A182P7U2_9DIPT